MVRACLEPGSWLLAWVRKGERERDRKREKPRVKSTLSTLSILDL